MYVKYYIMVKKRLFNHLYGINLSIKKPKHYYYFSGLEKFHKNYINVGLDEPNQTMAITLWFKTYDNKKGDIISLTTFKHNNVLKIAVEVGFVVGITAPIIPIGSTTLL